MEFFLESLKRFLTKAGANSSLADWLSIILLVAGALFVIFIIDYLIRLIIGLYFQNCATLQNTI